MQKNRQFLIAIMSLAVIGGISTVIFLEESISVSDRVEAENIETAIQSEPIYGTTISGEPNFGNVTVSISNLPNIGETAVVTVTNNDLLFEENPTELRIYLTSNLEFVDLEPTSIYHNGKISYVTTVDNTGKESISFSATIRAIEEGNARIHGSSGIALNTPGKIQMVISENTRLGQDISPRGQSAPSEDIMTKKIFNEGDLGRQTSECVSRLVTDEPFENEEEIDCVAIVTPWTEEEIRTNLTEAGETEEAIEHAIREAYPSPDDQMNHTDSEPTEDTIPQNYEERGQNSHGNRVSISGTLKVQLESGVEEPVSDVYACILEYDEFWRTYDDDLTDSNGDNYCTYTDENGQYRFSQIPNIDPDDGGIGLDISVL